ncbi:MAG: flagellar motor protein MotB [Bdellovibrionota bacterium]
MEAEDLEELKRQRKISRKRYLLSDDDDDSEEDVQLNESWLLSYSDLMTLLFGFFIILYALSLEERHKFETSVKSLAIGDFNKSLDGDGQTLKNDTPLENPDQGKGNEQPIEKSYVQKIEGLNQNIEKQKEEILKLETKVIELEDKYLAVSKELTVKKEQEKYVNKSEIKKITEHFSSEIKKKNLNIAELKKELKAIEAKNQSPNTKKEDSKASSSQAANNDKHLSVLVYWTTEKHDIDLSITTPEGAVFDFKNRKNPKVKGEFVLDSRQGPGAELWQQKELSPGIYKVDIQLYGQYDNPKPALVGGNISTKKGLIEFPQMKIDPRNSKRSLRFSIDKDYKVERLD